MAGPCLMLINDESSEPAERGLLLELKAQVLPLCLPLQQDSPFHSASVSKSLSSRLTSLSVRVPILMAVDRRGVPSA